MPSGVGNVEDEGILRGPIREVEAARQKLAANQGKEDEKKKKAWRSTGKDLNSDAGNAQASTTPEYWSKYNPGTRPEREEELKLMGFDARKYQ